MRIKALGAGMQPLPRMTRGVSRRAGDAANVREMWRPASRDRILSTLFSLGCARTNAIREILPAASVRRWLVALLGVGLDGA